MAVPLRVLIAEDSEGDALLLVRELRRGGYEPAFHQVQTAEALQLALELHEWDIVFADFSMPHFSGRAALDVVRGRGLDVPFIFVSGTMGEDTAVEAMKAGAQDYLIKGNLKRLLPAVGRELRDARERRERRRAEAALRATEERLRQVIAASTAVLYATAVTRQGFLPTWVSGNITRIMGYDAEEALAPGWWPHHLHPDDRDTVLGALPAVLRKAQFVLAYRFRHKDGMYRWIRDEGRLVRDSTGEPAEIVGAWLDVTEHKALEAQLLQAQKMEAIGRLAGGVAHDFNNIVTAIFGYTDLLAEDLPAGSPALQDVEEIRTAAARAASLTRQLLAFSRQQVLEPTVLSLNGVVENIEKMLRRLIGANVELRTVCAPDLGNVRADPGQLEQVILNLAVNACDAMPAGGKLTIETANTELTAEYAEAHQPVVPGCYVMLAVSDTGVGMAPEVRGRIFEPFFTTKEKGKGTGLGLSTVYGIVKQSGGYIWAYSEPGHGATFKVYLPRVDAPADPTARTQEREGMPSGTETVLVAEDDELLRPLARGILEKLGYTVLEAANAADALARVREHAGPVHLLITDVVMPGESGRELARRVADLRPETRVLYVSGYTDEAIVRHGMLEPGLNYLQKPFTPAMLATKVREVLDTPRAAPAR